MLPLRDTVARALQQDRQREFEQLRIVAEAAPRRVRLVRVWRAPRRWNVFARPGAVSLRHAMGLSR
jgi:hypothetical protein